MLPTYAPGIAELGRWQRGSDCLVALLWLPPVVADRQQRDDSIDKVINSLPLSVP